jgi:hypothetical protein
MSKTIQVKGLQQVKIKYKTRRKALKDAIEEWLRTELKEIVFTAIQDRFETESDGTKKWQSLASRTVQERLSQGYGGEHPILKRSGDMLSEVLGQGQTRTPIFTMAPKFAKASFIVKGKKALAHVYGNEPFFPQRNFMKLTQRDRGSIKLSFHKMIIKVLMK